MISLNILAYLSGDSVDLQLLGIWTAILIVPITLIIGEIALWDFIKKRRLTSLLLSISFFLLSIPSFILTIGYFNYRLPFDPVIIYVIHIVAFVLLALVCVFEIRRRSVKLHVLQKSVMIVSIVIPLLFALKKYLSYPFDLYAAFGFMPLSTYIVLYLSIGLMIVVVTLMFSLYRGKGNGNMLVGMIGFLMILLGWAIAGISIEFAAGPILQGLDPITTVAGLMGYIVILAVTVHERLTG